MPSIVRAVEVKVKKPKAGETAPVAAEAKEVVPEVAAEGAAATGAKKPKKEKKEGGEKKAPAAPVEVAAPAPWMVDLRVGTIIDGALNLLIGECR